MTRIDDHFEVANGTQDRRYSAQRLIDVLDGAGSSTAVGTGFGYLLSDTNHGGAAANGSDDTATIEAVWAECITDNVPMVVPPGTAWHYNGAGLNNLSTATSINITGTGRSQSQIILGANPFFVVTNKIARMAVRDITFNGGTNVFSQTYALGDSTDVRGFYNVAFLNYTNCAVQNNVTDGAFWHFRDCWFNGFDYLATMGIALSGLTDSCVVDACMFHRNRVGVKARHGAPNMKITNSEFIRLTGTNVDPRTDIWIVPHNTSTNAGPGLVVKDNKFGAEHLAIGDYRILYADELAGSDNGSRWPDLAGKGGSTGAITSGTAVFTDASATFTQSPVSLVSRSISVTGAVSGGLHQITTILSVDSDTQLTLNSNASATVIGASYEIDGWITGHQVKGNMFANTNSGAGTSPFVDAPVYSMTKQVRALQIRQNYANGPSYTYVIKHARTLLPDAINTNNLVEQLLADNDSINVAPTQVSNQAQAGYILDQTSQQAGATSAPMAYTGGAFSSDFHMLFTTRAGAMTATNATKQADLTDSAGGTDAAEYSIDSANGLVTVAITKTLVLVGEPLWVQFDIKAGSSATLTDITFVVKYGGGVNHFKRDIAITSAWRPHLFYFQPREALANLQFQFTWNTTGRFQIGRCAAYHSRNPVIQNAPVLLAQDGSTWRLLVDAAGVLSTSAI